MGVGKNKNFLELAGEPILIRTLKTFSQSARINFLIVIVAAGEIETVSELLDSAENLKPWTVTTGGSERQYSITNGLKLVPEDSEIILVHDAARPLISLQTIEDVIDAAERFGGAIAAVPAKNTIKVVDSDGFVLNTPKRSDLVSVQTPQGFRRDILLKAYAQAAADNFLGTDDASLVERIGGRIKIVHSDYRNIKVTTPEDIQIAETFIRDKDFEVRGKSNDKLSLLRMGIGYDVHRLVPDRKLILGNVEIPHAFGLEGHSDADVLIHAIIDALLGATALGDIGQHFPDKDARYKNIDSGKLLAKVRDLLKAKGYAIVNVDSIIVAQKPKLAPYILRMRRRIAEILKIDLEAVSVKATTEEGLGFTGEEQGIAAHATVGIVK